RRAVPWSDTPNLSVEQGRAVDVRLHEIANALVGVEQVARDLLAVDRRCEKRERNRRIVAVLDRESSGPNLLLEIDAFAIQTRRRSSFQAPPLDPDRLQGPR